MTTPQQNDSSTPLPADLIDQILEAHAAAGGTPEAVLSEGGLLHQLTGRLVERILDAEMTEHLGYRKGSPAGRGSGNSRNGTSRKTIQTDQGAVAIQVPRDRAGTFAPQVVPKHVRRLPGFDEKVIALYGRGLSVRQIQEHLRELYHTDVSRGLITAVTDAVIDEVTAWQRRPLEALYPIVYFDALFVKVRTGRGVERRPVYTALGIGLDGRKSLLGLWMGTGAGESAAFWHEVLTEIEARGARDVLIACVDGVAGFEEAMGAVFPQALVQQCIVHLVRQSLRYVPAKRRKKVAADLRAIYQAPTVAAAEQALATAEAAWGEIDPSVLRPWKRAWDRVIPFFRFPTDLRKVLYTTNAVEAVNRSLRSVLKTRGALPTETAVMKVLYLRLQSLEARWTRAVDHWPLALKTFAILYPDRLPADLR
jgi:putative transposase